MKVAEFISEYKNHPILFIGTGMTLRYLKNSFSWDSLLSKISFDLKENKEYYFDLKAECQENGKYRYDKIAGLLEREFNKDLANDRNGKFKQINDIFYEEMSRNNNISRFKIYLSQIFSKTNFRGDKNDEISELKKARKNIGSIITTNYDNLVEAVFEFDSLIGNDILLSNPYGSVYKIHGSFSLPNSIIITDNDYSFFNQKYELIRAQLLSLFIHNPIIFLGYNIGDDNIKSILRTIFTYIEPNSDQAKKIRGNFLLVEYAQSSSSEDIVDHDIDMEGFATIRINKIKTDNYILLYQALANLHLPVSVLDIRRVQHALREIYSGGNILVKITEDLDSIKNSEKILAIGTDKTIQYQFLTSGQTISEYFKIIDKANSQILTLIDNYSIGSIQYFPMFAFSKINPKIASAERLKKQQQERLESYTRTAIKNSWKQSYNTINEILSDKKIAASSKDNSIFWSIRQGNLDAKDIEQYLRQYPDKKSSNFKRLVCAYDFFVYGDK